jgi:integrase
MAKLGTKPNGIYYLDVQVPDEQGGLKRQRVSCDTRDRKAAEAQRRDWIAGLHPKHPSKGGLVAPKGRAPQRIISVSRSVPEGAMSVDLWLTKCLSDVKVWGARKSTATHQSNVRILSRLLDGKFMHELTSADIVALENQLRDELGYAEASIRKLLGSLSAACRRAEDTGLILARPKFPSITVNNVQDRVVSLDEEAVMFECIEARRNAEPLRPWWHFEKFCILLLDTAFRLSEGLNSGPSSVKRKRWFDARGKVHEGVWLGLARGTTKNDKPRDVPCTARVLKLIPELNERATNGRWFPWPIGSSGPLYLLQNIREDMKARGYEFDAVKLHTFRHTCATRLAEGGMDLVSLRDWLGHSDIKITAGRYIHLMNGHIYRGASILDAYAPGTLEETRGNDEEIGENLSFRNHQANGRNCDEPVTVGSC